MLPFFVVAIAFAILRLAGRLGFRPLNDWGVSLRWALAVMFLVTASGHWGSRREDLIAMVPPVFPRPDLLVTITGILEIAGAIGLMIPRTSRLAAASLAVLMIAMFPANVYAAQKNLAINGQPVTPLGPRAAVQVGLVAAAGAIAVRRRRTENTGEGGGVLRGAPAAPPATRA